MGRILIKTIESSSKANCMALYDGDSYLFLDFGASKNNTDKFFNKNISNDTKIAGALITHAHFDHVQSIYDSNYFKSINYFFTKETKKHIESKINKKFQNNFIVVENNSKKWIKINNTNWKFKTFKTIHNISGSVAFLIKNKRKTLLYLTDTELFFNRKFKNLSCYIVESNYGTSELKNEWEMKKHITKVENHMSIDNAVEFLKKYYGRKTKLFIFSHLSINGDKNKSHINEIVQILKKQNYNVKYLNPYEIMNFSDEF